MLELSNIAKNSWSLKVEFSVFQKSEPGIISGNFSSEGDDFSNL